MMEVTQEVCRCHRRAMRSRKQALCSVFRWSLLLLALLILPPSCKGQCSNDRGCYPPLGNLARARTVNASSTCMAGSEFCVFLSENACFQCDPSGPHSAASINDNDLNSFWVSEIDGDSEVTLQLDFEAPVLFENMTMVWESVRPDAMILERSHDNGATWLPYRFYSLSCADYFMLPDTFVSSSTVFGSTAPVCTSVQSQLVFGDEAREVTFSTDQHLQASMSIEEVAQYVTITNLRVRFLALVIEQAISGPSFRYYAVSEWSVMGSCACNGHASVCAPAPGEELASNKVYAGCMCEHSTTGQHCEQCAEAFNNVPWEGGTDAEANACEMCQCNGFAPDCQFDPALQRAVCIGCSGNTTGEQCDQCLPDFFQDPNLLLNDPGICTECGCDTEGTLNGSVLCDSLGQCSCKQNTVSRTCSECEDGYWNLTTGNPLGCRLCDCNPAGSVPSSAGLPLCDTTTGECVCRDSSQGERCDVCQPEFYDAGSGCVACDCNLGGSVSQLCDQSTPDGQCPCRDNVDTTTCTAPFPGFYFRLLDHLLFEAEDATLSPDAVELRPLPGTTQPFTGQGFVSLPSFASVSFSLEVPQDSQYELIIRYQTALPVEVSLTLYSEAEVDFDLHCVAGRANVSRFYFVTLSPAESSLTVESLCLASAVPYTVLLEHSSFSSTAWLLDSLLLLPDFSASSVFYASESTQTQLQLIEPCLPRAASDRTQPPPFSCRDVSFTLSTEFFGAVYPCECDPIGTSSSSVCAFFGGVCAPCRPGVSGLFCDSCANGQFNLTLDGCQACECDPEGATGPVCDAESGQCVCRPGVGGRGCGQCLPGFFNLTLAGCLPCMCSEFAAGGSCDATGQCSCPDGVGGVKCDQCLEGFYNISSDGCIPCNCDPFGSPSGECDASTGQCDCILNSQGLDCSMCPSGHFATDGLSRDLCEECVCLGRSQLCSVDTQSHALAAVQSNFSQLCAATPTECADGWMLLTSSGQVAAPYGLSDMSGLGYILLENDFPMFYAPERYLGNWLTSYGLDFTVSIGLTSNGALNNNTALRISGPLSTESLVGVFDFTSAPNGFAFDRTVTYTIPFVAERWRVGGPTGPPATVVQLLSVLANVTELSFTAQYTDDFIEFNRIQSISLFTVVPIAGTNSTSETQRSVNLISPSFPVEVCVCPPAYSASSCQECARGYARPSGSVLDDCVRCECNNQTLDCDVGTGVCVECAGNSEGDSCERCQPGYYGDPTRGVACLPCQCPLSGASFSSTCFLEEDGEATCDDCEAGYTGRSCEVCADGFFGSPLLGRCTTCECNGNVEPSLGPVCDTATGQCLNCLNNTEGFECELCLSGYFGDPALDIACQECPCAAAGSVGDCDRLTGACSCRPNVEGTTCSQCADGYWNLEQGCLPCDCCNDNTVDNGLCNQDTGRCSCIPNVGSDVDDKCCNCTPTFFNLTSEGCQPCNCSSLSVSAECDLDTGACQCQAGAIGLKCNDCAFGFTGRVPDCEPCHECYFQWFDLISYAAMRVSSLRARAELLTTTHYNGHNASSIEGALTAVLLQLETASSTLASITLNTTDIDRLGESLQQVEETLLELDRQVAIIENQLVIAQAMLDNVNSFDGSVNTTTILELQGELLQRNASIAALWAAANTSLQLLELDLAAVQQAWRDIDALNMSIEEVFADVATAEGQLQVANETIQQFQSDFSMVRMNLTNLDSQARFLMQLLADVQRSIFNASIEISSLNDSAQDFSDDITQRSIEAQAVLLLAQQLNASVSASRQAAQTALQATDSLQLVADGILQNVESAFADAGRVEEVIEAASAELELAKDSAQQLLSSSLPSVEYVQDLATQINNTILPEDVVEEIVGNATASRQAAESALATAQNASGVVSDTEAMVLALFEELAEANGTLREVEEAVPGLELSIIDTTDAIAEIEDALPGIERGAAEASAVVSAASGTISSAQQLGVANRERTSELLQQSSAEASTAENFTERVQAALAGYATLSQAINMSFEAAVDTASTVSELQADANELFTTVTRLTLEDLDSLFLEYVEERNTAAELSREISQLQAELTELTGSFTAAAQRLEQCYSTP